MHDVIIIGAGPAGLSACYRAKEQGLDYICFEKEEVANTLLTYPMGKDIHYYPADVEVIGKLPLPEGKATDTLRAWQDFASGLNIREDEEVAKVGKRGEKFSIATSKGEYEAKFVIVAIGVQGTVRKIPIECDEEKNICYKIHDPKEYKSKKMIVVGGGDTAIEHALLLKEAGADVTISYRKPEFFRLKDVNRDALEQSGIPVIFNSNVKCFHNKQCKLDVDGDMQDIPADAIAVFAGTIPPTKFLEDCGLALENNKPRYDEKTLETETEGLFIAGDLTKQPLIKPAINHGVQIIDEISKRLGQ
jgi:thioredoxin reductase